jgi:hypothetical protein
MRVKDHTGEYRRLERIMKGVANHRRLQMLALLRREPDLSVDAVAGRLHTGYINASDHLRKMAIAGLISKRNQGAAVLHRLTPRGNLILEFCKRLK